MIREMKDPAENFLPTDGNGATTGSIRIKNAAGLSVGVGDTEFGILKVSWYYYNFRNTTK